MEIKRHFVAYLRRHSSSVTHASKRAHILENFVEVAPPMTDRSNSAAIPHRAHAATALFVLSVLASACLMCLMQPLLARMLLPVFGGSPAVWNTCMVFFQMLLLAGYAYAHTSVSRLGIPRQMMLHAVIVLGSLAMLPHALAAMPVDAHP